MITLAAFDQLFVHSILDQEILFSSKWEEFAGRTSADLQTAWNEIVHPDDLEDLLQTCHRVQLLKAPEYVKFQVLGADGNYQSFLANAFPLINDNGKLEGICLNSLVHGECSHKLSRYALIKLIVNSLHALVAYVDTSRRYIYVNRAYEDFYQLPREEIEGQSIESLLGEEAYEKARFHIDKAFEGESVSFEEEFAPPSSGSTYHVRMTLVPHMSDGGKVKGCFVLGNPIEAGGIANARFEDLERFLSYWANNPEGFAHFAGWAIGRLIPHKFHDLFLAIGASYFSLKDICSRVDFLYELIEDKEELVVQDGDTRHHIATIYKQNETLCICGPKGQRMMLLRDSLDGVPYYSIRYFVDTGERAIGYLKDHWRGEWGRPSFSTVLSKANTTPPEFDEDHTFWNFRETDDVMRGVTVYPHSDGFSDPWETKHLAELIVQVSNLKNFDRKIT